MYIISNGKKWKLIQDFKISTRPASKTTCQGIGQVKFWYPAIQEMCLLSTSVCLKALLF